MNHQHEMISMMKKSILCLAAVIVVALLSLHASAATKVFLLGGQSNMAGVGGYSGYYIGSPWNDYPYGQGPDAACPSAYAYQPAVQFWNYADGVMPSSTAVHAPATGNAWINLQNGYGYRGDQFGPELSFGYRLHQLYPNDDIYLVKYGITSTSLAVNWNPNGSGATYNMFANRVNAAMQYLVNHGKNPTIAGMIWMQGEDDSTSHAAAVAYQTNLTNLIAHVRSSFINAADMKFVAGRITYMTSTAGWATVADVNAVRNAQVNVTTADGNAGWVDTDNLEWAYYGHYGTHGQIDLGTLFADKFAPVPEPSIGVLAGTGLILVLPALLRFGRWKHK
jgi:hypothetical protein